MQKQRVFKLWWAVAALSAGLTACGGGGGDTTETVAQAPSPAPAPVSVPAPSPTSGTTPSPSPAPAPAPAPVTSVLANRAWTAPVPLETSAAPATMRNIGISDSGKTVLLFEQADSTGRVTLQVVESQPNASSAEPQWTTPVVLDSTAPVSSFILDVHPISVSANGNALITWRSLVNGACATGRALCIMTSRKLAGATSWEAPVAAAALDSADPYPYTATINNNGDTLINFYNPVRRAIVLSMRTESESSFRTEFLPHDVFVYSTVGLDAVGGINIIKHIGADTVAYQGTVAAGLGATPIPVNLENRAAGSRILDVARGQDGTIAVLWQQDTATTASSLLMSVYSPTTGQWTPAATPIDMTSSLSNFVRLKMLVTDDGEVRFYSNNCQMQAWKAGVIQPRLSMPANCGLSGPTSPVWARNGNYIIVDQAGVWMTYDASLNKVIKNIPPTSSAATTNDYVLGMSSPAVGRYAGLVSLSTNGQGAIVWQNPYVTMPTPAAPLGDLATSGSNLWGLLLK